MDMLNRDLVAQLKSIKSKRIAVIDDTLQYFEKDQMLTKARHCDSLSRSSFKCQKNTRVKKND